MIVQLDSFRVSHKTLHLLAAATWHCGFVALFLKGCSLLISAHELHPTGWTVYHVGIAGFLLGCIKAQFLFKRSCRKNLDRISALDTPLLWQFFRPGFFLFLLLMILFGGSLSRLAQGNYWFLLIVAMVDLSVGFGLLLSGKLFWEKGNPLTSEPR